MGTWKLNVARSKFDPGPRSKGEMRNYESTGDGYKFSGERVDADGSTHTYSFTVKYDGKDYPLTGLDPTVQIPSTSHLSMPIISIPRRRRTVRCSTRREYWSRKMEKS